MSAMNYTPYITKETYETHNVIQPCTLKRNNDDSRKCVIKDNYLLLDSLYRTYGSNVEYISTFNGVIDDSINNTNMSISTGDFRNVVSIELKGASLPNINDEPYIILDIKELNGRMNSNVPFADQSFCVLYFDRVQSTSFIKPIRGSDIDSKIVHFDPPLASLSRLSIKFISPSPNPIDESNFRNTLVFNIRTTAF